ncbi:MAG: hypothetical protein WBO35_06595 [Candidatus Saccharimonadales bacterium]
MISFDRASNVARPQAEPVLFADANGQLYADTAEDNFSSYAGGNNGYFPDNPVYSPQNGNHANTTVVEEADQLAKGANENQSQFTKRVASFLAAAAVGCSVPYGAYRVVAGGDDRPLAQSVVEDFRGSANGLGVVAKTAFKASKVIIGVIH